LDDADVAGGATAAVLVPLLFDLMGVCLALYVRLWIRLQSVVDVIDIDR